jgi:hypothetical protein
MGQGFQENGLRDLDRLAAAGATAAHNHGYHDQERSGSHHGEGYRPVAQDHRLEQLHNPWAIDDGEHR